MTKFQAGAVPAQDGIRFRLGIRQCLLPVTPVFLSLGLNSLNPAGRAAFGPWFLVPWAASALLATVVSVTVPFGITLTPSAAVVRNLRRRTIPWASVQSVRVEQIMGSRFVALYEADGRRTRLRAPMTGFLQRDRDFEVKFHTIGQWWLAHRGGDWVPVPPPGTGAPAQH
ncbi:hypothetical protein [Streptomyces sp. NPDC058751]|uniref:hypothetical protein n=1 Tax=Streptomyces sp. NPDC058751 TaxID=3346623 RepID=UPI00368DD226